MLADKLIQQYKAKGHPLGNALLLSETDELISQLQLRLGASNDELNTSPKSLIRLESMLRDYHQAMKNSGQQLTDDETVQLVREIASYIGIVRLRHAQAIWMGGDSLWDTSIEVEGPIKAIKGTQRYTANFLNQLLGNQAASAWDAIVQGKPTRLYSSYVTMRRKVAKEKFTKRDGTTKE